MHCTVIGAGAWGLPAAAEPARRGHEVTVADRYGIGNDLSSSRGPTRLWRLADPAEGRPADADVARCGLARLRGLPAPSAPVPTALGRVD
ncbi:MAG TPA: FAD-binding oxidoreductase [Acidimicrobiales bacterium]|nr:FAD-binding oxidoreductase [Acidimicrobiales bacterium]